MTHVAALAAEPTKIDPIDAKACELLLQGKWKPQGSRFGSFAVLNIKHEDEQAANKAAQLLDELHRKLKDRGVVDGNGRYYDTGVEHGQIFGASVMTQYIDHVPYHKIVANPAVLGALQAVANSDVMSLISAAPPSKSK